MATTATALKLAETPLQRHLREEGRRQAWLAEKTGIKQGRLSMIVRGVLPDPPEALAICATLGREVKDFWEIDDDDPTPTAGAAAA